MNRLDGLTATGTQRLLTFANNGDIINMILYYRAATQEFSIDISWASFNLEGFRVFSSPNLLFQFKNIIPFGLAVITTGGGDPIWINDFSTGRANMYVLTPDEVEEVNQFYVGLRDEGQI